MSVEKSNTPNLTSRCMSFAEIRIQPIFIFKIWVVHRKHPNCIFCAALDPGPIEWSLYSPLSSIWKTSVKKPLWCLIPSDTVGQVWSDIRVSTLRIRVGSVRIVQEHLKRAKRKRMLWKDACGRLTRRNKRSWRRFFGQLFCRRDDLPFIN